MFSAGFWSVVVALAGLAVWGVRYLISRNKRDVINAKNTEKVLDSVKKANDAAIRARNDKSIIDRLREKYNIK